MRGPGLNPIWAWFSLLLIISLFKIHLLLYWASLVARWWFDPWIRKIPWRREWQPTPVFLPGEFHGQRSLEGYSPWGLKESDTTEQLTLQHTHTHTHTHTMCLTVPEADRDRNKTPPALPYVSLSRLYLPLDLCYKSRLCVHVGWESEPISQS